MAVAPGGAAGRAATVCKKRARSYTLPIAPPASSHRGFSMGLDLGPGAVAPSPRAAAVGNRLRQDLVSDQSRMPPEYAATNSHSIMHT